MFVVCCWLFSGMDIYSIALFFFKYVSVSVSVSVPIPYHPILGFFFFFGFFGQSVSLFFFFSPFNSARLLPQVFNFIYLSEHRNTHTHTSTKDGVLGGMMFFYFILFTFSLLFSLSFPKVMCVVSSSK
ncbi:hypothetical protein B0F90DRAFT_305131 [Multifurca ochricompacta]|uniref:Uncharacterized protein n=1 Tax=Multifurca ochricompacta TaxID=376703 RepID=A0AAD4QJG0_9AGAM|nr:hypothetical protein B0F90DRAFT_305131 [Multifurca ochricompacta]